MGYKDASEFAEILYKTYPLLSSLSKEQLHGVDLNVLWVPSQDDQTLIEELGARLRKYVVIYNADYEPKKGHLCRMIKAAALELDQIKKVQEAERRLTAKNKILVVYEKPLMLNQHF
jgi:hypothetical protein